MVAPLPTTQSVFQTGEGRRPRVHKAVTSTGCPLAPNRAPLPLNGVMAAKPPHFFPAACVWVGSFPSSFRKPKEEDKGPVQFGSSFPTAPILHFVSTYSPYQSKREQVLAKEHGQTQLPLANGLHHATKNSTQDIFN